MLPTQRHLFDLPDDFAYLNCAYMAPQPRSVTRAGIESVNAKTHPWKVGPDDFFNPSEEARSLFAQVLGSSPDDIALIPAASYGLGVAAANLKCAPHQRIVVLAEQFPSNVYPWRAVAHDVGCEIYTVPRPQNGDWTPAVLDALGPDTAIAALPHCHWTDGSLLNLNRVAQQCRKVGAALVLDLTQSLGAMPLDLDAVSPDFAVAAGYKWLLGPYSLGFLYVAPRHHHGVPLEQNWISRDQSENFAGLVDYRDDFQPGARRFDVGERSNFVLVPMAVAALRQVMEWKPETIANRLREFTAEIAERARALGWSAADEPLRAPHMLGLRSPSGLPAGLATALSKRGVSVSVRGDSVRVSPHVYNTADDIDRLFTGLIREAPIR